MTYVLVVDDDSRMRRILRIVLQARGYSVVVAADGETALAEVRDARPAAMILDLGLSDMDGVDVIRSIRSHSQMPIIVLSDGLASAHRYEAFEAGADDFVSKPFNVEDLVSRVGSAVADRPTKAAGGEPVAIGAHLVHFGRHEVRGPGADIALTRGEWNVLELLVRNAGKLVTARQMRPLVRGSTARDAALRLAVAHLRQKLEVDPRRPRHLLTEPGLGYRFKP